MDNEGNNAKDQRLNPERQSDPDNREELVGSIANASIDSMVAVDTHLKIVFWNETAALWSGKTAQEVVGKLFFEVFPSAKNTGGIENGFRESLAGRKSFLPVTNEFYLDGYFETHFVPLKKKSGEIWGILQIIHDVAHRIKAENELISLNNQLSIQYTSLQHANEELANFAKIASHDLKEPLRKIYTFVEFILMKEAEKLSNTGRSYFRSIQKSAQRMALLTDDIANFSELSHNSEPLQQVHFDSVLLEAKNNLKSQIEQMGAEILSDNLPVIAGYPHALEQLFRQVISNAIKFRKKEEPPRIQIGCEKLAGDAIPYSEVRRDEQYYCICFRDNGIGFDTNYSSRIFGLFQRLHTDTNFHGSGMGLAVALKVARMHRGFMKADSAPGKGSSFYFYLPVLNS